MKLIDLRSDTVTKPTPAMREVMARAEVGDDVYGEDPSVRRLEERAAELLGKAGALFVPSGTMANQIALRILARSGDVVLAGHGAHILRWEGGAAAALWGLQIECIGHDGFFDAGDLHDAIPPDDPHYARASVVAVENSHNASGGRIWKRDALAEVAEATRALGLRLHLDGARLWNAVAASGDLRAAEPLAAPFDTVAFCLSKGLGAPVGSLICCGSDALREARRARKLLGGGMRQSGVLAAAGLHALEHHLERLVEDHVHATRLAEGLMERGIEVAAMPETNMVLFAVPDAARFTREAKAQGVLLGAVDRSRIRAVTHLDVSTGDVDEAVDRLAGLCP